MNCNSELRHSSIHAGNHNSRPFFQYRSSPRHPPHSVLVLAKSSESAGRRTARACSDEGDLWTTTTARASAMRKASVALLLKRSVNVHFNLSYIYLRETRVYEEAPGFRPAS